MTNEERIKAGIIRHPDWPDVKIAQSADCRKADVAIVRAGGSLLLRASVSQPAVPAPGESVSGLVSMEKVVARYDVKSAILREIGAVPEGALMLETELCLRCSGQDRNRFRRTVENNESEFKQLRVKLRLDDSTDGKWYWGHPKTIAEALKIRDT
jgi:hypothetical protein